MAYINFFLIANKASVLVKKRCTFYTQEADLGALTAELNAKNGYTPWMVSQTTWIVAAEET